MPAYSQTGDSIVEAVLCIDRSRLRMDIPEKHSRGLASSEYFKAHPEFMASSIAECCSAMLWIKQRICKARMDVLARGMEFCRLIYGSPSSATTIVILYVCQACGWSPKYVYDYFCIGGHCATAGWYCCTRRGKHCKPAVNGAFGIHFSGST